MLLKYIKIELMYISHAVVACLSEIDIPTCLTPRSRPSITAGSFLLRRSRINIPIFCSDKSFIFLTIHFSLCLNK